MTLKPFIYLILLLPVSLWGQFSHRADSLEKDLYEEKLHDSTRIRLMIELAEEIAADDSLRAFHLIDGALEVAIQGGWKSLEGEGHRLKALIFTRSGRYPVALDAFDRALESYSEAGDQASYFNTLKEKGNVYLYLSDLGQAQKLYESSLAFFRTHQMNIGTSNCLNNLGIIYKNRGEYGLALSFYEESVMYLDSVLHSPEIARAYINMGNVLVHLGAYHPAMDYFNKAMEIAEREKTADIISLCLCNNGVVQNKLENYAEALRLYFEALDLNRKYHDPIQESNCLINIGTNYANMGEPAKGLEYLKKGLQIKKDLGDERAISNGQIHLAELYYLMGELSLATDLFEQTIPEKERLQDPDGLIRCYLGLGYIRKDQERLSEARQITEKGIALAREIEALEHLAFGYGIMEEIAAEGGDFGSAYAFSRQRQLYQDSLMDQATARAAMEMEFRNRSRLLEKENENLRYQARLDQLEMRKRSVIIYSVLTITGILALALILVAYFLRKLKITSLKLEEKNLVITRQNVTLDRIGKNKDRLMSIIAHDLRGTIGNQITAVEVLKRIEENEQPEIDRKRLLGNLKKSASYSLELLENLLLWSRLEEGASNFLPEPLRLNTLVHNCVSLYSETAAQKEIDIIEKIPLELSCSVDRIMMEAIFRNLISNAVKFSNSGDRIEVGLDQQGDQVHFWVRDQGIGMDQEQLERIRENGGYTRRGTANEKGAGMGISLVREFIQFHKGRLEISSEADKGSLFEVYFPCEND